MCYNIKKYNNIQFAKERMVFMSYNELKQRGTLNFPIELYQIDKNHSRFEMAAHWHSEIEIIRVLHGTLNVKLNNREYIMNKHDVVFVNSENVHSACPSPDCIYDCIVMHTELLSVSENTSRFFLDGLINHEFTIYEFNQYTKNDFFDAIDELFNSMKTHSPGYKFNVISAVYKLFAKILDGHLYYSTNSSVPFPDNKSVLKLKKVLSYIRNNYDKPISLDNMAEVADMSSKYFCSFFKDMTAKTPVEYLNTYRIEKASRKLINSDTSVTDIAFSCGFNDLSYFIKTFKTVKGTTPAKFRKNGN